MPTYLTHNTAENCIMARIRRRKKLYQANFMLNRYATYEKAEAAAKRWVKAKLAELPDPLPSKGRKTSRNTSGVVGVRLADATRHKNGNTYPDWRWVAFWPECANAGGVGWSVNKYGDDGAFVRACLARQKESVDRKAIETAFAKFEKSPKLAKLLALKQLELK